MDRILDLGSVIYDSAVGVFGTILAPFILVLPVAFLVYGVYSFFKNIFFSKPMVKTIEKDDRVVATIY